MAPGNPFARSSESKSSIIIDFYDQGLKARDAHGRTLDEILSWQDIQLERSHNYIQMLFPLPEGSPYNWAAPVIDRAVMDEFRSRSGLRHQLRRSFERMLKFYGFQVLDGPPEDEEEDDEDKQNEPEKGEQAEGSVDAADDTQDEAKSEAQNGNEATNRTDGAAQATSASDATESQEHSAETTNAKPTDHTGPGLIPGYYIGFAPHWQQAFRNWAIQFDHNHLRMTRILRCLRVLGLQTECEAFYDALKRVFNHPHIRINDRSMMYWRRAVRGPIHVAPDGERIVWLKKWAIEQLEKEAEEEEVKERETKEEHPKEEHPKEEHPKEEHPKEDAVKEGTA